LSFNKDTIKFIIFSVLTVVTIALGFYFGGESMKPEAIKLWVGNHGILAPLVYMIIFTIAAATLIPGTPVAIAGGALFGWLMGSVYTIIGAVIAASITFLVARHLGESFVSRFIKEKEWKRVESYREIVENNSFSSVVIFRLIPLIPFTVFSMVLGLTRIRFSKFFLGTLLGIIPGTFAYVYFGESIFQLDAVKTTISVVILLALSSLAYFTKGFFNSRRKDYNES